MEWEHLGGVNGQLPYTCTPTQTHTTTTTTASGCAFLPKELRTHGSKLLRHMT